MATIIEVIIIFSIIFLFPKLFVKFLEWQEDNSEIKRLFRENAYRITEPHDSPYNKRVTESLKTITKIFG